MSKRINFSSAVSAQIGTAASVRLRTRDGALQMRFTDRTSLVNLPKDEKVVQLGFKGAQRRLSLNDKTGFTDAVEVGSQFQLVAGKYGWFTMAPMTDGATAAGRVSA